MIPFFGISRDVEATDGEFEAQGEFDGGGHDGIVSEDLLNLIGVFGISSDANTGITIGRDFGAAEEERVDLIETDAVEVDLSDTDIEAMRF